MVSFVIFSYDDDYGDENGGEENGDDYNNDIDNDIFVVGVVIGKRFYGYIGVCEYYF